jgi:alpha-methylacyl-CoA racemase
VLAEIVWSLRAAGSWTDARASNVLDGGAPYYRTYRCSDGRHLAVAAIEPQFYRLLVDLLGVDVSTLDREDPADWPVLSSVLAAAFAAAPRAHWETVFAGTDACVTPVLQWDEAPDDAHLAARRVHYEDAAGSHHAGPAPRFSRTPNGVPSVPSSPVPSAEVLDGWAGGGPG